MAEKEMTKEEQEAQQKEEIRKYQLGFLQSEAIRNLYVAAQGRDTQRYGAAGKSATQANNYISALANADEYVSGLTTLPYLESAQNVKPGQDIYEAGVSASHIALLNNAEKFYQSAISAVKVSDMIKLLGWEKIHEKNISAEDKNMFMADFAKKNEKVSGDLVKAYLGTVADLGVSESIAKSRTMQNQMTLEALVKDPEEMKEGSLK